MARKLALPPWPARLLQMRCRECAAETAGAQFCVRCGAPAVHQLSVAADPGAQVTSSSDASAGQQLPSRPAPELEAGGVILAGWVEARRFSTTRLRPGYDQEEVDAFLTEIRDSFLGVRRPSLTSDEIRASGSRPPACGLVTTRRRLTPSSMRPNCGCLPRSCRPARGQARTTRGHARTWTTGASALRSVTCRAS